MVSKLLFIDWLELKGLSQRSIKEYCYYFDKLEMDSLDQDQCLKFLRKNNNLVARAFLNNLINYVESNKSAIPDNTIFEGFRIPKRTGRKPQKIINVLSKETIHQIAQACKTSRDHGMVLLSFYCGLRPVELLTIKAYDFDWRLWLEDMNQPGNLKVTGKGRKQRMIPVVSQVMVEVYDWLKANSINVTKQDPIFKIGLRRWERLFADASSIVLDKAINPYVLRHSCATHLLSKGFNLKEIADFLGHKSILTTQQYLHLNQQDLRKKVVESLAPED